MSFFNFGDFSGTPKRPNNARSPPTIPFCTSPSQLQEVTLYHDGTFSNTMGLRSPGGPLRGRSVKEFEEQLSNLKKENFNLKLRIYFLEEKMGSNFTLDKDNVVKKYIELQVDYANLRKEIDEKQELLCQAVKAMELEDEEHKKYLAEKEEQLNNCQQEIEDLRVQLQLHLEKETNASFQLIIGQAETLKTRCENMQHEIQSKDEIIKNLRKENDSINSTLESYAEQVKDIQEKHDAVYKENQSFVKKILNENRKYEELTGLYHDLKKKYSNIKMDLEREHKKTERVKSAGESRVRDLEEENDKLKHKLRENQAKLETALTEIRKNQNLAVSKSLPLKSNRSLTDVPCISVQDTTTPAGTQKKDSLHVQLGSSSPSIGSSPSSPEKFNNIVFEDLLANASSDKILSVVNSLKSEYLTQKQKLFKLKTEQIKACEIIKTMIDSRNKAAEEITQYQAQIKNLERELESVVTKPTSDGESEVRERLRSNNEKSAEESQSEEMEVAELYKALTVELENKIEILEATLKEKDDHLSKIREQNEDLLNNLEQKNLKIAELEFEQISTNSGVKLDKSYLEKGDTLSEKDISFYEKEMEEKDKEIERLKSELKKCTCYLQELVNTELWEKNKEIEKMHNRQVNSPEILKLKKDLTGKEQQLKVLIEKISELGLDLDADNKDLTSPSKLQHVRTLQDELKAAKEEREYFKNKVSELESTNLSELIEKLKTDLETSEKLRLESNEACTLLSSRLEELAVFLNSLLKQKLILGFLGIQKERKLREYINNSIDLSKVLNMSLTFNGNQSLTQLSNITAILNDSVLKDLSLLEMQDDDSPEMLSIVPGNITLTYQSHLYKQNKNSDPDSEEVITALREQIINLKSELQLRDNELNKLNANGKLSETDDEQKCRNLSGYARELSKLYISPQKSNTTSTTLKYQSDCASESEGWSEPDRTVSRARIGLTQKLPDSPTPKTIRLSESTDDDNLSVSFLYNKRHEIELQQEICDLKCELEKKTQLLEAAEQKITNMVIMEVYEEVKQNLLDAEGKIILLERLKTEFESHINDLNNSIKELKEDLIVKDDKVRKINKLLESEKNESAKLEEIVQNAKKEKKEFENKEKDYKELENQLRKNLQDLAVTLEQEQHKQKVMEIETIEKIRSTEEVYEQKLTEIEKNYTNNYIKKSEVESKIKTVTKLSKELDDLKEMVKSYEETIQTYQNREQDYENRITEFLDKVNGLRKDLDMTTLEYSELVLEKTRLANEKAILEEEFKRCTVKDGELRQQIHDISQNYQKEIAILQKEKSELQMRISILESNNAELHNRFVKNEALRQDFSTTMPNIRIHQGVSYNRQCSNPSFSSEDNLEECSGYNVNAPINRNRQQVDDNRQESNASPDLGIESDQGRFSSMEIYSNNISRPLLQTIELTETMSTMLDDDNNQVRQNVKCDPKHCCQKSLDVAYENNDLKRKLLRMRRALEETANQLNLANQRKKEVEKTICKQIHKTSQVLRKAKANLDSGSESDIVRM